MTLAELKSRLASRPRQAFSAETDADFRAKVAEAKANGWPAPHKARVAGMEIVVENPVGSVRSGVDKDGKPWSVRMRHAYGYLCRATGSDGECLDVFLGPDEHAANVYVIHQNDPDSGCYDEDKAMLQFPSPEAAKAAYLSNYNRPDFFRSMTIIPLEQFKAMLTKGEPGGVHWKRKNKRDHATEAMFSAAPRMTLSALKARLGATVKGEVGRLDVANIDVSPEEEVERMRATKGKEVSFEPYKWRKLTRSASAQPANSPASATSGGETVAIGGNTFPVKDKLREMGGKWDADRKTWVVPAHRADEARRLVGGGSTAAEVKPQSESSSDPVVRVRGNTFPHKDRLKRMGFRWDGDRKVWYRDRAGFNPGSLPSGLTAFSAEIDGRRLILVDLLASLRLSMGQTVNYAACVDGYFAYEQGDLVWRTIGGQEGEDGKRHGGTPVQMNKSTGEIEKGPAKLAGHKVSQLKEIRKPADWRGQATPLGRAFGNLHKLNQAGEPAAPTKPSPQESIQGLQHRTEALGHTIKEGRQVAKEASGNRIEALKQRMQEVREKKRVSPSQSPRKAEASDLQPAPTPKAVEDLQTKLAEAERPRSLGTPEQVDQYNRQKIIGLPDHPPAASNQLPEVPAGWEMDPESFRHKLSEAAGRNVSGHEAATEHERVVNEAIDRSEVVPDHVRSAYGHPAEHEESQAAPVPLPPPLPPPMPAEMPAAQAAPTVEAPSPSAMPDFPHHVSASDYLNAYKQHRESNGLPVIASQAVADHEKAVSDALKGGHHVDPEILKDYAHLQPPHEHQKAALAQEGGSAGEPTDALQTAEPIKEPVAGGSPAPVTSPGVATPTNKQPTPAEVSAKVRELKAANPGMSTEKAVVRARKELGYVSPLPKPQLPKGASPAMLAAKQQQEQANGKQDDSSVPSESKPETSPVTSSAAPAQAQPIAKSESEREYDLAAEAYRAGDMKAFDKHRDRAYELDKQAEAGGAAAEPTPAPATAKAPKPVKSKIPPGRNDLRKQITEAYKAQGGGLPSDVYQFAETLQNPYVFKKGGQYAGEVRRMMGKEGGKEGVGIARSGAIKLTDGNDAGGEDAIQAFRDKFGDGKGEDYYWQLARERSGAGFQDAIEHARKSQDPNLRFMAAVHDTMPKAGEKGPQEQVDPSSLHIGEEFKLHGIPVEVKENEDGEKMLVDGGDIPETPVDALAGTKIPVDKGTRQEKELPAVSDNPFDEVMNEPEPRSESAASATERPEPKATEPAKGAENASIPDVDTSRQLGMFAKDASGNPIEVGEHAGQANLFNPSKYKSAEKPVEEKVKPQFDPSHTSEMFPAASAPAANESKAAAPTPIPNPARDVPGNPATSEARLAESPIQSAKERRLAAMKAAEDAAAVPAKPVDPNIAAQFKRATSPQVAAPAVLEPRASLTSVRGEQLSGKGYAIPGFEEYKLVAVPPRGSRANHNKTGWDVYEQTTGTRIAGNSVPPPGYEHLDTAENALKAAHQKMQQMGKPKLDEAIASQLSSAPAQSPIDALKQKMAENRAESPAVQQLRTKMGASHGAVASGVIQGRKLAAEQLAQHPAIAEQAKAPASYEHLSDADFDKMLTEREAAYARKPTSAEHERLNALHAESDARRAKSSGRSITAPPQTSEAQRQAVNDVELHARVKNLEAKPNRTSADNRRLAELRNEQTLRRQKNPAAYNMRSEIAIKQKAEQQMREQRAVRRGRQMTTGQIAAHAMGRPMEGQSASPFVQGQAEGAQPAPTPVAEKPTAAGAETPVEQLKAKMARQRMVEDFGEKIGGARKDIARPLGARAPKEDKPADERPGWARKYQVHQDAKTGKHFVTYGEKSDPHSRHMLDRIYGKGIDYDTKEEAEKAIPLMEVARGHRVSEDRKNPGMFAIHRKVSDRKLPVVKGGFKSELEAKQYMAQHPEEIIGHKFPFPDEVPHLKNVERTGKQYREGHIKPVDFHKTFGFRGGEFGNWNTGHEGQEALNHAYDGLHDLADVIGVPPKAVSLDGNLSIAFGARGTGGKVSAKAHYEPDKSVMNLTKIKGAGSLAHEWFHALDHYVGKLAGKKGTQEHEIFASHGVPSKHAARQEVVDSFKNLVDTMTSKSIEKQVEPEFEAKRHAASVAGVTRSIGDIESRLKDDARYNKRHKPFTPEQQKHWDELKAKVISGDVGKSIPLASKGSNFHSSFEPIEKMNELYKSATGRSFSTADAASQGRQLTWQVDAAKRAAARVAEAAKGMKETKKTATSYFNEARSIDAHRASNYWSEPHEMAARAFSNYVEDRINGTGNKSQYLSHGSYNHFLNSQLGKPYPEGEEKSAIHAAFDRLFKAIKTQERKDDKGNAHVQMFSADDADEILAEAHRALEANGAALAV